MSIRPPPKTALEYANRSWRPSLAWLLILVIVPAVLFAISLLSLIVWGVFKAIATGQAMPDVTAGLDRILAQIMPWIGPALVAAFTGLMKLTNDRTHEVRAEITAIGGASGGGHNLGPFPSSAPLSDPPLVSDPSPTGGLVNDHALQGEGQ